MYFITDIFFDLDHTLWDFDRNSNETLTELFDEFGIRALKENTTVTDFIVAFQAVNYELWGLYNQNRVGRKYIRDERFGLVFDRLGIDRRFLPKNIALEYLFRCPQKKYLEAHTKEVLAYLANKYKLHILTNGFEDVQFVKLKSADILHYFDVIVTSECIGYKKPSPEIFNHALKKAGVNAQKSVMIGDNPEADIVGAKNVQMTTVLYNSRKVVHNSMPDYEVFSLKDLQDIL
jgi:putative hydrolase of the HAD superfamily